MKKTLIILAAFCYLALNKTSAQDTIQPTLEKKTYNDLVKIETNTGESIEAAFVRRTPDTVFIAMLEKGYVKAGGKRIKILKEETEKGIAIDQIKNYDIKNDPNIVYRDELKKRKKQLRGKNAWKIAGIVTLSVVTIAALPVIAVGAMVMQ